MHTERDFCRLVDDHIKIERLSNDDARYLFRKVVGDIIDRPSYKKIADRLLKECGGMPQVIKLTADGLRNEDDPSVWRQLLSDMQSPATEPVQEMQELYKAFKLREFEKKSLLERDLVVALAPLEDKFSK